VTMRTPASREDDGVKAISAKIGVGSNTVLSVLCSTAGCSRRFAAGLRLLRVRCQVWRKLQLPSVIVVYLSPCRRYKGSDSFRA
jgi:hypothetical protein